MPALTVFMTQMLLLLFTASPSTSDGDGACPSSWSREHPFNTDSAAQEEAPAASLLTWPTWSLTDNNRRMAHRGTFSFPSVGCLQKHLPPLQSLGHDKAMPALTVFMTQASHSTLQQEVTQLTEQQKQYEATVSAIEERVDQLSSELNSRKETEFPPEQCDSDRSRLVLTTIQAVLSLEEERGLPDIRDSGGLAECRAIPDRRQPSRLPPSLHHPLDIHVSPSRPTTNNSRSLRPPVPIPANTWLRNPTQVEQGVGPMWDPTCCGPSVSMPSLDYLCNS
ncbi:hypothetical protein ISCGN_027225 [Ixodes scapularis]